MLQKIFGKDLIPDKMIGHAEPTTMRFEKYQNNMLTVYDSPGFEIGQTKEEVEKIAREFVRSKQECTR